MYLFWLVKFDLDVALPKNRQFLGEIMYCGNNQKDELNTMH